MHAQLLHCSLTTHGTLGNRVEPLSVSSGEGARTYPCTVVVNYCSLTGALDNRVGVSDEVSNNIVVQNI